MRSNQWSAGISGIQCGVGLNHIVDQGRA
jgi:hypothetical protein